MGSDPKWGQNSAKLLHSNTFWAQERPSTPHMDPYHIFLLQYNIMLYYSQEICMSMLNFRNYKRKSNKKGYFANISVRNFFQIDVTQNTSPHSIFNIFSKTFFVAFMDKKRRKVTIQIFGSLHISIFGQKKIFTEFFLPKIEI